MTITTSGTTLTFSDSTTMTTVVFPAGTAMLFQQTSAPTGWTKSTTYNDYAIRITNGTASTGGSSAFSTCFANQTPTINVSGLSAGATTLTTAQIPSHLHTLLTTYAVNTGGCFSTQNWANTSGSSSGSTLNSGNTGGGGSHSHSLSGSATSSAITLNVTYANVIICSKN
jgi:hypothetical protein